MDDIPGGHKVGPGHYVSHFRDDRPRGSRLGRLKRTVVDDASFWQPFRKPFIQRAFSRQRPPPVSFGWLSKNGTFTVICPRTGKEGQQNKCDFWKIFGNIVFANLIICYRFQISNTHDAGHCTTLQAVLVAADSLEPGLVRCILTVRN